MDGPSMDRRWTVDRGEGRHIPSWHESGPSRPSTNHKDVAKGKSAAIRVQVRRGVDGKGRGAHRKLAPQRRLGMHVVKGQQRNSNVTRAGGATDDSWACPLHCHPNTSSKGESSSVPCPDWLRCPTIVRVCKLAFNMGNIMCLVHHQSSFVRSLSLNNNSKTLCRGTISTSFGFVGL